MWCSTGKTFPMMTRCITKIALQKNWLLWIWFKMMSSLEIRNCFWIMTFIMWPLTGIFKIIFSVDLKLFRFYFHSFKLYQALFHPIFSVDLKLFKFYLHSFKLYQVMFHPIFSADLIKKFVRARCATSIVIFLIPFLFYILQRVWSKLWSNLQQHGGVFNVPSTVTDFPVLMMMILLIKLLFPPFLWCAVALLFTFNDVLFRNIVK